MNLKPNGMTDTLISFETAKLAREKGFNIGTPIFYGRAFPQTLFSNLHSHLDIFGGDFSCFAPTQSLLQRWLRKQHISIVEVVYVKREDINIITYQCTVDYYGDFSNVVNESDFISNEYNTYEEALEVGLQKALKLLL